MNIAWQYLDKRAATIEALKDFPGMRHTLSRTEEEIAREKDRMTQVGGAALSDMPRRGFDPGAGENRVASAMDHLEWLEVQQQQAKAYMHWFLGGWRQLSEEDRTVLKAFFLQESGVEAVCEALGVERAAAYKRRERAVSRLSLMLYGK